MTGVQTCALPISLVSPRGPQWGPPCEALVAAALAPAAQQSSGSTLVLGRLSNGEAGLPGASLGSAGAGRRHCWPVTPTGLKGGGGWRVVCVCRCAVYCVASVLCVPWAFTRLPESQL